MPQKVFLLVFSALPTLFHLIPLSHKYHNCTNQNSQGACKGPGLVTSVLCTLTHFILTQTREVNFMFVPLLQMKSYKLRKVKQWAESQSWV